MISREWIREVLLLKRTPRTGWYQVGLHTPESVGSHTFSLALLVWKLARQVGGVDAERCATMALVHDLHEVHLGDIPTPAKKHLPEGSILAAERSIADSQWADDPDGRALVEEFLAGETEEARLVQAADNLEFLYQAAEYRREGHPRTERMLRRAKTGAAWRHPVTRPHVEILLSELESPPAEFE
jgi:putative hydrolase of HD superfamily